MDQVKSGWWTWARAPLLATLVLGGLGGTAAAQTIPVTPSLAWASLGVDLDLAVRWVPVQGRSLLQVRAHLRRMGPEKDDGSRVPALTSYVLSLAWAPYREEDVCRVAQPRVKVLMTVLLPDWVDRAAAHEGDAAAWGGVLDGLIRHEADHRDRVLEAAYRLAREVRSEEASTCPSLMRRVDRLVQTVRDDVDEAHALIDRSPVAWVARRR